MVGNPFCRRFHPLLVLECVRTQVVMTSLGDVKRHLPTRKMSNGAQNEKLQINMEIKQGIGKINN